MKSSHNPFPLIITCGAGLKHSNGFALPLFCSPAAPTWVSSPRSGRQGTPGAPMSPGATEADGAPAAPSRRSGLVTHTHAHVFCLFFEFFLTFLFRSSLKIQAAPIFSFSYICNLLSLPKCFLHDVWIKRCCAKIIDMHFCTNINLSVNKWICFKHSILQKYSLFNI